MRDISGRIVVLVLSVLAQRLFTRKKRMIEAYEKAQDADLEWSQTHHNVSYEESHRNRNAVLQKYE